MTDQICPSWFPAGRRAQLAFVGEAPGAEEIAEAEPLVGPSGRVFNQLLKTAGIDREACFITNVFDVKLPGNELTSWTMNKTEAKKAKCLDQLEARPPVIWKGKSGRWLLPEHWGHLDRLHSELAEVQPKVIVPLGSTALWALTGHTQIMAWRGTISRDAGPTILPTLHPAYVMRNWKSFLPVAGDLARARDEVNRPVDADLELLEPEFLLNPSLQDIESWWQTTGQHVELLAVDIETGGGQIKCVGFCDDKGPGLVVPFIDERKIGLSYWGSVEDEAAAWELVRVICESSVPKVMQNGSYDLFWLWRVAKIAVRNYLHDPRLQHHAYFPEMPKSLEFLGPTYCRIGPWKTMRASRAAKKDE